MADILPPSAPHDTDHKSRFTFLSASIDSMSPASTNSHSHSGSSYDKGGRPYCNGLSATSPGSVNNYGPHGKMGSVSSDTGSLNSVFYKSDRFNRGSGNIVHGNEYIKDPMNQCQTARSSGPISMNNTTTYPITTQTNNSPKNTHTNISNPNGSLPWEKQIKPQPVKINQTKDDDTLRKAPFKNNGYCTSGNTHEVTYSISDELENRASHVVLLPPPPAPLEDVDSDNDSMAGCDGVGPCQPRHLDWRDSRDFTKSPTSRAAQGNSRCLCCMLLIFILSTAGLSTVLVLMYMGMLEFSAGSKAEAYVGPGRVRLGDGALVREVSPL